MGDIICSRNRYVIPFTFTMNGKGSFEGIVRQIDNHDSWAIRDMRQAEAEQDLYGVILDSFMPNDKKTNIGCAFSYTGELNFSIRYNRIKDRDFIIEINQAGLFLFRTGVGLFWYEVSIPGDATLDDAELFQNEFKELSYERFTRLDDRLGKYTFENMQTQGPVLMGDWVDSLLRELKISYSYLAEREHPLDQTRKICDKALIFEYVALKEQPADRVYDFIHRFTNGYNSRYKRRPDFEAGLKEPFDNAYFYATESGAGYYVVPHGTNMGFYTNTHLKKVVYDYFNLYILALYQFYSILNYTRTMESELPGDSNYYLDNSEDALEVLKQLGTEINVFLIKSVYSSVSHVSHQNDFYKYLTDKLRIKENIEGLTIGLDSLRKLQESRESERLEEIERRENDEREAADRRVDRGLGLLSIFAIVSAVSDGFASAEGVVKLFGWPSEMVPIIEQVLFWAVMAIGVIAVIFVASTFKRSKKSKKHKEEKNESSGSNRVS